jgi:hypothetical protein
MSAVIFEPSPSAFAAYPANAVATVLTEELLRCVRARYRRKGQPLKQAENEVLILAIDIDSLTVVELLSSLDEILPFKVTECVVKAGGYKSIDAAVKHVVERVESKWKQHHSGASS